MNSYMIKKGIKKKKKWGNKIKVENNECKLIIKIKDKEKIEFILK